jgi:dsDNA-specific endonuclease/ATPase MutS2
MSISKRWFEEQQEARRLLDALSDVRDASRTLHSVENADDLTISDICRVCRLLASAEEKLADAIKVEEVTA